MSHSIAVPPVHETSPPPLDDDIDDNDNDIVVTIPDPDAVSSTSANLSNDVNDDWKSIDENDDQFPLPSVDESPIAQNEPVLTAPAHPPAEHLPDESDGNGAAWADFATFEAPNEEVHEIYSLPSTVVRESVPAVTSAVIEEPIDDGWADFESNTTPSTEQPLTSPQDEQVAKVEVDEDDFGEFSEVQVTAKPPPPSLPIDHISTEQLESLLSVCFPTESSSSPSDHDPSTFSDLPSFTTIKAQINNTPCLEPSLSLWRVLSNLSNDPLGITFQWRKSNTERLFHQALGVNERFRAKSVPLTPEILQPEKVKSHSSIIQDSESIDQENKSSSPTSRPHFDWKQSGLENPLADNDSSSLSSTISKNEDQPVFDANKTLDLDFYVPPIKSSHEEEHPPSSTSQNIESPIVSKQRTSIPIKTMDLFPGSTTTLNDDAKRILDSLPNLSYMSAKALMFPVRFNGTTHDESTSLF